MLKGALRQLLSGVRPRRAPGNREAFAARSADEPRGEPPWPPRSRSLHETQVDVTDDDVDRLVRLTFGALLHREPDSETLHAYRDGFARGSTFHDLIDDVVASEEYEDVRRRARRVPGLPGSAQDPAGRRLRSEELRQAVEHLAQRLAERGVRIPFDAVAEPEGEAEHDDRRRLRSLQTTLSALDRL